MDWKFNIAYLLLNGLNELFKENAFTIEDEILLHIKITLICYQSGLDNSQQNIYHKLKKRTYRCEQNY